MIKTYCPECNGVSVKNGFQNNRQRYNCKSCNKRFQLTYTYNAYNELHNNPELVDVKPLLQKAN